MNIFVLDNDPKLAAQYHCDKHVVKMILETAQLLSTTARILGTEFGYKLTHKNHPCSIWARTSKDNAIWLQTLGVELLAEYKHRYGKIHKSGPIILNFPITQLSFNYIDRTPFVLAMPDKYKIVDNPVQSYRTYYLNEKRAFASWKNRSIPDWWKNQQLTT